jgi:Copper type II ascorbate-dependent monooxygenase, C-terminal domain/Copper type II ascorbate-dependent monooxygenase, N-terminal domain
MKTQSHGRLNTSHARILLCALTLAACMNESDGTDGQEGLPCSSGNCSGASPSQPGLTPQGSTATTGTSSWDGGTTGSAPGGGGTPSGAPITSNPTALDAGSSSALGVPCEVASILSKNCAECHNTPLAFGAPMPLLNAGDFQAIGFSNKAKKVFELIPDRLAPADNNRKMPPTSKPPLSAVELETLKAWVSAGAKPSAPSCAIMDTSTQVTASPDAGSATATTSGGAHITPIAYNDPDMECYNLVAFANGNKTKKFSVPGAATDMYVNFYYKAPWTGARYTRSVEVITDNKAVIHHWLLFNNRSPGSDGTAVEALGTHGSDEELLYGWAPGASPMYLDPDVGQKLEGGTGFTLEAHYNNPSFTAGPDASGAKLCVTKKVPAHEAGLSWVGTDSILGTSASGTCDPQDKEIHLIVAQPHMHKKGKHMTVTVNRRGGKKEVIHNEDFSFENQRYYPLNVVLQPGDTMTTTCDYNGLATFGRGTNEEMCYFFSLHWPAGALVGGVGGILHGGYSCL